MYLSNIDLGNVALPTTCWSVITVDLNAFFMLMSCRETRKRDKDYNLSNARQFYFI